MIMKLIQNFQLVDHANFDNSQNFQLLDYVN